MANEEHLAILKQGVKVWNAWREENPDVRPDLSEANLASANLSRADLSRANLTSAKFSRANLILADLRSADLSGAWLDGADLMDAHLDGANLTNARLRAVDLSRAWLNGAKLMEAHLTEAHLTEADLSGADLSGADLAMATMVETYVEGVVLTNAQIYGISVWDIHGVPEEQGNLNIARWDQSPLLVDNFETAQFIHLLLHHKKLRNAINAVTQKGVLLLGRFGDGGLETLQAIADKLRSLSYLPIIFDFDRPDDRDYTETIMTLAGLSRFVIADLSGPSVPQELYATVPHLSLPFVFINEQGHKPYALAVNLLKYPWVLGPPVEYPNKEGLVALLEDQVIGPAEEKHREIELQKHRDALANG